MLLPEKSHITTMATITQNQILEPHPLLPLLQQQQQSQQLQLLLQLSNISYSPHISAAAVVMAAVVIVTAIIVIHKKKNNQYDEPKYCAAFATAAVSVTE